MPLWLQRSPTKEPMDETVQTADQKNPREDGLIELEDLKVKAVTSKPVTPRVVSPAKGFPQLQAPPMTTHGRGGLR
jgi:hypothetical protein